MKTRLQFGAALLFTASLFADQRMIVRTTSGNTVLKGSCAQVGCTVAGAIGDPEGQLFVVTIPDSLDSAKVLSVLQVQAGVVSFESDQQGHVADQLPIVPAALYESDPVTWFGTTTRYGFVFQPAGDVIRVNSAQSYFGVSGAGVVAVIDTGVDPDHPALRSILLPGYDSIRATEGSADEKGDVTQSTTGVVDNGYPCFVGRNIAALLDTATAALIGPDNSAFGHGTMVSGIVHLVAPAARILPIKAFSATGTGYASDVVRGVYYAARHGSRVINMSFTFPVASSELNRAVSYATASGAICVAAAGNDGTSIPHYPAAFSNVMAVASTTDADTRSSFSDYGSNWIWVAAPGEGIVTTYPFGTFAAGWGTSFSTPFVSGTVALLLQNAPALTFKTAADAVAHAQPVSPELGYGRLDVFKAVQASTVRP